MLRIVAKGGGDWYADQRSSTAINDMGAVLRRSIGIRTTGAVLLLLGCSSEPSGHRGSRTYGESSSGGDSVPNAPVHASGSGSASGHFGPPGGSLDLAS